ncbi:hypothetical protein [Egicoccus sp. AB-alg2]|uniref:hypothetical protein n=1 Tax=Egicoccus sp. AB-alg2 TaxID=3242693 RepID=UPI00359DBD93
MSRLRRRRIVPALVAALAFVVVGCGGEDLQPSSVEWRNVSLDVPDGWYVYERADTHLSMANANLRPGEDEEFVAPEEGVVSMAFTYDPGQSPDDWRRFVEEQDATLESDTRVTLDDEVPATQIVFSYVTNGVPTREMVTLIPSRAIVVLSQPVPGPGDDDAPEVFLDNVDTFRSVLESAEFGQPQLD